jgi:hypothetical protein
MKRSIHELACAMAVCGGLAFSAQAQAPPAGAPTVPQPKADAPTMPGSAAFDPRRKAGPDPHPQAETPPVAGAAGSDPKASADAQYMAAQKACDAKTGPEKDSCFKNAKAAYDRALGRKDEMPGAGQIAPADTKQK